MFFCGRIDHHQSVHPKKYHPYLELMNFGASALLKMQSFLKCKVRSVTLFCGTVDGRNPAQCKYRYTMIYKNTACVVYSMHETQPQKQCDCPCQFMQDFFHQHHNATSNASHSAMGIARDAASAALAMANGSLGNWSLRFSWTLNMTSSGNVNII